ncbi:hypothetical protein FKP32DRAFT_1222638 [Trametes sanguinea]|nr:hypothetical protein FKP32DRAFT_1222638 [Trametes sanguinea]
MRPADLGRRTNRHPRPSFSDKDRANTGVLALRYARQRRLNVIDRSSTGRRYPRLRSFRTAVLIADVPRTEQTHCLASFVCCLAGEWMLWSPDYITSPEDKAIDYTIRVISDTHVRSDDDATRPQETVERSQGAAERGT